MDMKPIVRTAILIDGGFYRKRAKHYTGLKTPKERADELESYCRWMLTDRYQHRQLYRIFYYDCPPLSGKGKSVYHPLLKQNENLAENEITQWTAQFFEELKSRRKFALRLGRLSENDIHYNLKPKVTRALLDGRRSLDDLKKEDFQLNLTQKGVDMRIGVDISSMAFKKQVDQIILVAGDSDFVPAAKQARREGIDFILNPMGNALPADLHEHIDGICSRPLDKLRQSRESADAAED